MSSKYETPQRNGKGLRDPFTDDPPEMNGEHSPNGEHKRANRDGIEDGNGDGETPTLFYAYARRSDNHWASRYLLTFASASVCAEWWSLVQSEYPDQATRHGPQLFSFEGDDFPHKPATSKRFEHLKTKWFYSQFGDASGTGGRTQEIIPLQDWEGRIITGGGVEPANNMIKLDKGKGRDLNDDADSDSETITNRLSGFDFSGLAESLQSTQSTAEINNAQIAQLAEHLSYSHDRTEQDQERMSRIEALVQENAEQLQALSKSHIKAQQQNRELAEQNAKILRELKRQRTQAQKLFEHALKLEKAELGKSGLSEREMEAGEIEAAQVVVHPPPRKIDRLLIGYAYQSGQNSPVKAAGGAAAGKRPVAGGRTTSAPRTSTGK